jgi:hypothetical protein
MVRQHPEQRNGSPGQVQLKELLTEPDLPSHTGQSSLDGGAREEDLGGRTEPDPNTLIDLFIDPNMKN